MVAEDRRKLSDRSCFLKDIATLTIDTSGDALHKRGYREFHSAAPLKETMAAAMLMLTNWKPDMPLYDVFTGSGTLAIEAAMIGRNIAPGINREFVSQEWKCIPKKHGSTQSTKRTKKQSGTNH